MSHRKLLDQKIEQSLAKICSPFCTPSNELVCTWDCFEYCPEYCHDYLSPDVTISTPSSDDGDHHHPIIAQKFLVITVSLIITTFLALCCYVFYFKYYEPRRRRRRRLLLSQQQRNETHDEFLDEDHGPVVDHPIWYINTVGLQPSIINAIAVYKYKKGEGLVEGTDCSVCLSEFEEDETLRLLPKCSHAFHITCIDAWLRSHTNCPMCRAPIVKNPSVASAASSSSSSSQESDPNDLSTNGDARLGNLRENGEAYRELGDGVLEGGSRETEEGDELELENCRKISQIQPPRRSFSFDYASASKTNHLNVDTEIQEETVGSSDCHVEKEVGSNLGVIPKRVGPVSMIRSISCSGKFLLSKRSR